MAAIELAHGGVVAHRSACVLASPSPFLLAVAVTALRSDAAIAQSNPP
jgi:hypothetical protein